MSMALAERERERECDSESGVQSGSAFRFRHVPRLRLANVDEDEDEEGRLDREKGNMRTLMRMKNTIVGSCSVSNLTMAESGVHVDDAICSDVWYGLFFSRDHESAHDAILSLLHSTEQNSIVPYCDDDMDDFMADTLL